MTERLAVGGPELASVLLLPCSVLARTLKTMPRTHSAILLAALLAMRAVFGMDISASVLCVGVDHDHLAAAETCLHDCSQDQALLRPIPADLHEHECGCDSHDRFGGESFTVTTLDPDLVCVELTSVPMWIRNASADHRVAFFRGPPRGDLSGEPPQPGRVVILQTDRLNI